MGPAAVVQMRRLRPLIWASLAIAISFIGYIIILPGTTICGATVGGLTVFGAARKVESALGWENLRLTLTGNGKSMEVSLADDLGLTPDYASSARQSRRPIWAAAKKSYPLRVDSDAERLSSIADMVISAYAVEASDARYYFDGDEVKVAPDIHGWTLDVTRFMKDFAFESGLMSLPVTLELPGVELLPSTSAGELESYLPFESIAEFETRYADGNPRSRNILLCSSYLSEITVGPSETFSFNRSVGPRTKDRGYEKAPVFVGDQTVDDYGGGVCQVSTTLYISMLKAGFQIAERYCHAKPVDYVPLGFDATVAYDYLDLRMTNPGPAPCLVRVKTSKGKLLAEVFGQARPDLAIEVESRVLKEMPAETPPPPLDPSVAPPAVKLRSGYLVETVRKWVKGGKVERVERLNTSMYPAEKAK